MTAMNRPRRWKSTSIGALAALGLAFAPTFAVAQESAVHRQGYATQPPDPPHSASGYVGSGFYHGWFRYPGDKRKPVTFYDSFFLLGEPLLADTSGVQTTALVSDWQFAYKATYTCPSVPQVWELKFFEPDGSLFLDIRDEYNSYPNCDFRGFVNGALTDFFPGTSYVQEVFGPPLACDLTRTGVWTFTLDFNGTPVDLATIGMTDRPEVVRDFAVELFATSTSLHPALPDESTLPYGGINTATGQVGFYDAGRAGDIATVRATLSNPICTVAKGTPIEMSFEFLAGTGGHVHHATGTTPVLAAAGLGAEDVLTVVPFNSRLATFDASTGVLSGITNDGGSLVAEVTAGEVAGGVQVVANVPGGLITNGLPPVIRLSVEVPGLAPLFPIPGLFEFSPEAIAGHGSNYFVKATVPNHVAGMASAFQFLYNRPFMGRQWVLIVKGASIPQGGLLDRAGDFDVPESFHRTGRDIDLSQAVQELSGGAPRIGRAAILKGIASYINNNGGQISAEPDESGVFDAGTLHVRFP